LNIEFYKYQGTGNDFVVIDNRAIQHSFTKEQIIHICSRKFGIGSDGLILIQNHSTSDFEMVFYNPDASQSFCGNGSRCAVRFAKKLGLFENQTTFLSTDGLHTAELMPDNWVSLQMHDVPTFEWIGSDLFIDTGSPHYISPKPVNEDFNLIEAAKEIRYSDRFREKGINVNYIHSVDPVLHIRTYERGVENETLSCGTGVTASVLAKHLFDDIDQGSFEQEVSTPGGNLQVAYEVGENGFTNIYLKGPASMVYKGTVII
jgi:diaminopimelate epimerase